MLLLHFTCMAVDGIRRNSTRMRREEILAATLDCFVEEGAGGTFITDVCGRAEVSVGTLYHHFGSKEQLLATLHMVTLNAYQAYALPVLVADPPAHRGVTDTVAAHLRWLSDHPREATFLLQQPFVGQRNGSAPAELVAENNEFLAVVRAWLARRSAGGELRDLPFDTVVALLIGPIHHWIRAALHEGQLERMNPEVVDAAVAELGEGAWQALRSR
jgi:AcrR family transcriptional regulator